MVSLVVSSPLTTGVLRSLRNQRWAKSDEVIVFTVPGEEAETAIEGLKVASLLPNLKVLQVPLEPRLPPWDCFVQGVQEAANDWVWLLPEETKPSPRGVEIVREALAEREDAKLHLFRAYGQNGCLMPVHPARESLVPREVTVACAVVPRGLARLAQFHAGQWGDLAWLDEAARLHPAGDEAIVWHNRLVALKDNEHIFLEERLEGAQAAWSFRPTEFIKTSEKEEVGRLTMDRYENGWHGRLTLADKARGRGYRAPIARFALEAAGGQALTLYGQEDADVQQYEGICYLWDRFRAHQGVGSQS